MSDPILNGTNPAADRRLIADVMKADAAGVPDDFDGDAFDGGCPADVLPRSVPAARADDMPTPTAFAVSIAELELRYKYQKAVTELWDTMIAVLRDAYLSAEVIAGNATERHFNEMSEQSRVAMKHADGVSNGLMRARQIIVDLRVSMAGKDLVP